MKIFLLQKGKEKKKKKPYSFLSRLKITMTPRFRRYAHRIFFFPIYFFFECKK